MSEFDKAFHKLMEVEGGYVNHPSDLGGPTNFGITQVTARDYGYYKDMKELPESLACTIYRDRYWVSQMLDRICDLAPDLSHEMFDTAVNMGVFWAGIFLQQVLNSLNKKEILWHDIKEDGDVGNKTIEALISLISKRGEEGVQVLLKGMNCLQGARYIQISRARQANEDFTYGWLKMRV